MKLTVLGRWGAYPEQGESTSGFLLQHNNYNILIDCGSGVLSQLQKYLPIEQLDACIITHFHHDHIADLGCLQYAMQISQILGKRVDNLPIYAPKTPLDKWEGLLGTSGTSIHSIESGQVVELHGMKFHFFETVHPIYCLGIRIQTDEHSIVYTSDTAFFDGLVEYCHDADLMIADTSFYMDQNGAKIGHMNTAEVAQVAKAANVKKLVISHLPHFGRHQDLIEQVGSIYQGAIELSQIGNAYSL